MSLMKKGIFSLIVLAMPIIVFAQEVGQITDLQFLEELLKFVGGLKGAGTLAIVAGVVQLLMQALKAPFISKMLPKLTGAMKLLIVSGLTVVGGVLMLMNDGMSILQALLHSTTLAALQVFGNQLFQQFMQKKKEESK